MVIQFADVLELFFPSLCIACGERLVSQEKFLCLDCWNDLPVTSFHDEPGNKVEQLFWGRIRIERAASYFQYRKGSRYQHLIHFIKYKGLKELGYEAGLRFGSIISGSADFSSVDVIVPVPLHRKREKQRGYNQSEWIGRGIAWALQKPLLLGNLVRAVHTKTQTRKTRFERWENVENIFVVTNPSVLAEKHVLLVDDVVTTGSTLEACAGALLQCPNTKVSVATLAFSDL